MSQQKSSLQPVDFIIIYIGGALLAGWLQMLLYQSVPTLTESTAGRLISGLWLQDGIMLLILLLCLRVRHANGRALGACRPQGRRPVLGAVLAGLLLYVLMAVMVQLVNAILPNGLADQNVQSYMQPDDSLGIKLFVIFTMGVFVPIVEELIFRGYLFHSLLGRMTPNMAMLFTALIFGAAHLDWQRMVPLALGGYLLNVVAVRYQSVFASAISHGVWNIVMMILYYCAI